MPELRFAIRWPDDSRELCYSPSTVVRNYFIPGKQYPLETFVQLCREALGAASERVREQYGIPCARAMSQLAAIETTAARFAEPPASFVEFENFQP